MSIPVNIGVAQGRERLTLAVVGVRNYGTAINYHKLCALPKHTGVGGGGDKRIMEKPGKNTGGVKVLFV